MDRTDENTSHRRRCDHQTHFDVTLRWLNHACLPAPESTNTAQYNNVCASKHPQGSTTSSQLTTGPQIDVAHVRSKLLLRHEKLLEQGAKNSPVSSLCVWPNLGGGKGMKID